MLGWPAIALSVFLTVSGFRKRNEYLVLGAIVPVSPVGFYILGSPIYWWLPVTFLFLLLVLFWHIRRTRRNANSG